MTVRQPIIFMYSGQASQYYQMGRTLFQENAIFRTNMKRMDDRLKEWIGESILSELYYSEKSRSEQFDRTLLTHCAIFMVEHALTEVLKANGLQPDIVVGSSLGEFAAAVAAGVIDVEDALQAVAVQASRFESLCSPGGMLAILHDPAWYDSDPVLREHCEVASINNEDHFVVTGHQESISKVQQYVKAQGIACQRLPVTQGFHSSALDPAEKEYVEFLKTFKHHKPQISFISSLYGRQLDQVDQDHLWKAVRMPIRFNESVSFLQKLVTRGVYLDLGPSGTLAAIMKRLTINPDADIILPIMTPFQNETSSVDRIIAQHSSKNKVTVTKEEKPMRAYVFPGQGSQAKGMGGELFDRFPEITSQADAILGYSIKELCLEDPRGNLNRTDFTQPALYTVNALMYLKAVEDAGTKPNLLAGHSLGEYNALYAAGAFDFATGLKLVKKRGELMSQAVGGGMAAVIGLDADAVNLVLKQNPQLESIDIANYNSSKQFVIAGKKEDISQAQPVFEMKGARYVPLKVSGAFHSRYMSEARDQFERYIQMFEFTAPNIPVIANVSARPYRTSELKSNLSKQITHAVKWCETIQVLLGFDSIEIKEIGPGIVLSGLTNKIRQESVPIAIDLEKELQPIKETSSIDAQKADRQRQLEMVEASPESLMKVSTPVTSQHFINIEEEDTPSPAPFTYEITAESLGSENFKKKYRLKYAYLAGAMYKGIASKELVVRMGKAGMLGILGTGGMALDEVARAIQYIQAELHQGQAYGMNLLHSPYHPEREEESVDLYLKYGVNLIEASAYMAITPSLIKYRAAGLIRSQDGSVSIKHRIIGKVSRPEVAEVFLSPAPEYLVERLIDQRKITREQANLLKLVPMADDLCLEADSAGHTDGGAANVLLPAILILRDEICSRHGYSQQVGIGAAGGIGMPEAAASAFILGADFIVTGSINQCTVEAGTSDAVKDLLQQINIQDTAYAPAGDMFEMGAKVQVLRKGVFFPARANKLQELYRQCNTIDDIPDKEKHQLQDKYFKMSFDDVYREVKVHHSAQEIEKAEKNPKHKMALIFKWYFAYSTRIALQGKPGCQVDYQVHCGPALGAFNQWVKGTSLESWRSRHVDEIAIKLMGGTADVLNRRIRALHGSLIR
ncbi:ACP S-malonyltransferase [Paenibacillus alvei]|uniref:[acyl-carrier-protein] S-malonyltransferase n=1 Tax=Paenibacillus alvei TaxID=44250 RepID=A0A383RA95_PAEAL|nr:ACP S-malonyltransferase [Paenibacillus alvei]SYX83880.1 [acyl-carrier-protein] S-malonyltransferase [Paenibacillus alvei]